MGAVIEMKEYGRVVLRVYLDITVILGGQEFTRAGLQGLERLLPD